MCIRDSSVGGLNPNTLSNYVQGVSYILYTYNSHHNFGRTPTVEKFNPQLFFCNLNTGHIVSDGVSVHPEAEEICGRTPNQTCSCKMQPNRQFYAATWLIQTRRAIPPFSKLRSSLMLLSQRSTLMYFV